MNDILVVLVTGAYNYSMASHCNHKARPATVLANEGSANLIICSETYDNKAKLAQGYKIEA